MIVEPKRRTSLSQKIGRWILPIVVFTTSPIIEEAHADDLILRIARCESQGNQFDANGRVLRNKYNHEVVGVFQINERYHAAKARELGFNIYTTEGNWGYARWLLEHSGTTPWLASKQCWQVAKQ